MLLTQCRWDCFNLIVYVFSNACSSIGFTLTDNYCRELGLWAYYIFISRLFLSIELVEDVGKVNLKYYILIEKGVNRNNSIKVLLPIFDSLNHL